jgi:hypothetical protein
MYLLAKKSLISGRGTKDDDPRPSIIFRTIELSS